MTIVIAPDKFKGSLTADQVCEAVEKGVHKVSPASKIISVPLADGGEGTAAILTRFAGGQMITLEVTGPDLKPVRAELGISKDGKTAFIEMAKASGLQLLALRDRNPMNTSTYGTGQMIRYALEQGVENIVMGIGGSATNDAGVGMAAALGFDFISDEGDVIVPVGRDLLSLRAIKKANAHPRLAKTKFTVLCDVDNPLYGINGAAWVFAPQKGALPEQVQALNQGLQNFEKVVKKEFGVDADFPGAGAAGGLGAGAKIFLGATIMRGFEYIAHFTGLDEKINSADMVITGEGKVDTQTLSGKVVKGVAALATKHKKKCIAFAGKSDLNKQQLKAVGIDEVITLVDTSTTETEAITDAALLLEKRVADYISNCKSDH